MRLNWWVRWIVDVWSDANLAWEMELEQATMLYPTEVREYAAANPRPTLKQTMVGLKGCGAR